MYTVYSYEIIDGDIDFLERLENKGQKDNLDDAFALAKELDNNKSQSLVSIVHLVYDENDNRM